ncbi:PEP-utilizing enzyme [Actinomadura sp. 6N118]|uniref:PEP-utilizing enzyme n=1 Tax=Actinomadura sp. 6N118 TaxID=3375151 RepID=UPI003791238D
MPPENTASSWDTAPNARFPIYTRLNAADVLPDPLTPLGASLAWRPHIFPGWAAGYFALDAFRPSELDPAGAAVGGIFYGHLYVNQSSVRVIGIRAGIGADAIDAAFFAHPDAPPHVPHQDDVNEELSELMAARTQWALTTTSVPEIEEEQRIADRVRAERPDLPELSLAALVARARSVMPIERLMWRGETIGSNQAAIGPGVIGALVGAADPSLLVRLIGKAGDVDSAAPSYALWELSREVWADPGLTATFDGGVEGLAARIDSGHPDFAGRFRGFLREFGYRGPGEWDIGADSWETRPELVLALVDRLRHLGEDASPVARQRRQAEDTQAAMDRALEIVGDDETARQTLRMAVASARRFAAFRERGKTNAVKVLHEARVALLEVGRRLHEAGHLDGPRQVFMALEDELDGLVAEPQELKETLARREKEWQALFGLELPTFIDANSPLPPLEQLSSRRDAEHASARAGDVLQGAPASGGVVRGRARVVTDISQIAEFEPGEILVAPQTDPSWTPLFMASAGVVVDTGSMGSHAMIVSRELGIPCAAGVQDATRRIPTGALVEVDGSTGTVTVLDL